LLLLLLLVVVCSIWLYAQQHGFNNRNHRAYQLLVVAGTAISCGCLFMMV
jgi:hypothetical protein